MNKEDYKLYTKGKPLDDEIMTVISNTIPIPKTNDDAELYMIIYGYALRRKEKKLKVTKEYIKWLYKQITKESLT